MRTNTKVSAAIEDGKTNTGEPIEQDRLWRLSDSWLACSHLLTKVIRVKLSAMPMSIRCVNEDIHQERKIIEGLD